MFLSQMYVLREVLHVFVFDFPESVVMIAPQFEGTFCNAALLKRVCYKTHKSVFSNTLNVLLLHSLHT